MKITQPGRDIDVIHTTDVMHVAAGPGVLAAPLAAARAGVAGCLLYLDGLFGGQTIAIGLARWAR